MRVTLSDAEIQFRIFKKEGINLHLLKEGIVYMFVLSSCDVA